MTAKTAGNATTAKTAVTDWLVRTFVKDYRNAGDPAVRMAYGRFAGVVGIVCNTLLCLGKGVAGLAVGSVSIVADAVNNLSDASSNVISLLGFKMAAKPPDHEHPYGHGRYEYLAGMMVAILIVLVGVELVKTSFAKVLDPTPVEFGWVTAAVLVASMLVKLWMTGFNRTLGRRIGSETLEATAVDSRNDVLTTGAVLVAAVFSAFTDVNLDGWMGLAVGAFIVWSGIGLVRDTVDPLLGHTPDPELVKRIHDKILSYPGVLGTHDLMVHDYGPGRQFASVHVEMAAEADVLASHDVIDNIEQDFLHNDGLVMTIHYDPIVTSDAAVGDLHHWISEHIREIDPRLTIHDLRTVPGTTHTNVIFDCVRPCDLPMSDAELKRRIAAMVQAEHPEAVCKVTIDSDYVSANQ